MNQKLIAKVENHLRQLAPHIRERESQVYLVELIKALKETDQLAYVPCLWICEGCKVRYTVLPVNPQGGLEIQTETGPCEHCRGSLRRVTERECNAEALNTLVRIDTENKQLDDRVKKMEGEKEHVFARARNALKSWDDIMNDIMDDLYSKYPNRGEFDPMPITDAMLTYYCDLHPHYGEQLRAYAERWNQDDPLSGEVLETTGYQDLTNGEKTKRQTDRVLRFYTRYNHLLRVAQSLYTALQECPATDVAACGVNWLRTRIRLLDQHRELLID